MRQVSRDEKDTFAYYLPVWLGRHIESLARLRRTNKSHEAERLLRVAVEREAQGRPEPREKDEVPA
jgi:hypothetical protein